MKKLLCLIFLMLCSFTSAYAEEPVKQKTEPSEQTAIQQPETTVSTEETPVVSEEAPALVEESVPTEEPSAPAGENKTLTEVNVIINLMNNYYYTASDYATFVLSDGIKTYEQTVSVAANREALGMTFDVDAYAPGKTFTLTLVSGIQQLLYYDKFYNPGEELTLYTYEYTDEYGITHLSNTTYMSYIPVEGKEIFPYFNGEPMNLYACIIGSSVMFPLERLAEYMQLPTAFYDSNYNSFTLERKNTQLIFNMDTVYTTLSGWDFNSPTAPTFINGIAYAPISVVADAFGINLRVVQNDKGYEVFLIYTPPQEVEEKYVNETGLQSDTSYLIWVSKKDFTVNVFLGSKGNWDLIKTFPCSIGAPDSPTCEGTYKYYESIAKWDYGSYYVAPVMRFNRGYALHSTLINENGTMKDARLGEMISHGCVRLDPPDMNWLHSMIPLQTTVHVTP